MTDRDGTVHNIIAANDDRQHIGDSDDDRNKRIKQGIQKIDFAVFDDGMVDFGLKISDVLFFLSKGFDDFHPSNTFLGFVVDGRKCFLRVTKRIMQFATKNPCHDC